MYLYFYIPTILVYSHLPHIEASPSNVKNQSVSSIHSRRLFMPSCVVYLPFGHCTQSADPIFDENVPMGQNTHFFRMGLKKVPGIH
jgi:hypothetical protein